MRIKNNQKSYSVRDAIKLAIHWHRVAEETGNREVQRNCREFIRANYRNRHSSNVMVLNRG